MIERVGCREYHSSFLFESGMSKSGIRRAAMLTCLPSIICFLNDGFKTSMFGRDLAETPCFELEHVENVDDMKGVGSFVAVESD